MKSRILPPAPALRYPDPAGIMLFDDVTFVVTDTETTGSTAGNDRLIEIGAVKMRGNEVVDTFSSLINPGCAVPRRITRLTGISTAMVFDQPGADKILPRFVNFLGDAVFVAHNLSFDRRVINSELLRAGMRQLTNDQLCTLRLARRVLPGLRSRGLSSLVDFFQIHVARRHRALDDAAATAEILVRLLGRLALDQRVASIDELIRYQNRSYGVAVPPHVKDIRERIAGRLPKRPGIYFMKDDRGRVIYVGKAKNLRSRVGSYFRAIEAQPGRVRKMLDAVRDVEWKETGTELEALLAESRLIKEFRPRFNRALKRHATRPFIKLHSGSSYPTVSYSKYIIDDGAEYFGPVPSNRYAEWIVDIINRMYALRECDDKTLSMGRTCLYGEIGRCCVPCEEPDDRRYAEEVHRVRDFLLGRDQEVLVLLEEEMRDCARRLEFEEAGSYRDSLERLRRLFVRQKEVAASVLDHNAVLAMKDLRTRRTTLFFVSHGRLARTLKVTTPPDEADCRSIRYIVERTFGDARRRPDRYMKEEVDEIRILANWMYSHRRQTESIHWSAELSPAEFSAQVVRFVEDFGVQEDEHEEGSSFHEEIADRIAS